MRAKIGVVAALALVASACDRGGRVVAEPDSGIDAGVDDAAVDGSIDDGSIPDVDAGPPSPLAMSRDQARMDAAAVSSAMAAVDPSLTAGIEFLQLEMGMARLDAVIGEKIGSPIDIAGVIGEKSTGGMMFAAFPLPVAAVIVIRRQLAQAQLELAAVAGALGTPTDPSLIALTDALAALVVSIGDLHAQLGTRYDALVAAAAALPGTEDLAYEDARSLHLVPDRSTVFAVLEGSATDTDGSVTATCDSGGTAPFAVSVRDDHSDAVLLDGAIGAGPHHFVIRAGEPTLLRIDLLESSISYDRCDVQVSGRRHSRGAPLVLDALTSEALGTHRVDWDRQMTTLIGLLAMMKVEGLAEDMALAPVVDDYLREASSESGRWRAGLTSISPEDLDVLALTLERVIIPLGNTLESSAWVSSTTSSFAPSVKTLLGQLRTHNEFALATLRAL